MNKTRTATWTDHAATRWRDRSHCPDRELDRAYRESVKVDYPSARNDCWGRYHQAGDCVLICKPDATDVSETIIKTVIALSDRSSQESHYVRCQAGFGGR